MSAKVERLRSWFTSTLAIARQCYPAFATILTRSSAAVGRDALLKDTTVDFYNDHVNCNIRGLFFLTQKVLPHLAHGGRIVIVSSVAARLGVETQGIYSATKAAGEALARVWAKELGHEHGITVNCVNPGPVATGTSPLGVCLACANANSFRSMACEYGRIYRGYAADYPVDTRGSKSWRGGGYCASGFVFVC